MNIWEIATNYYQYFLRGTQTTILISLLTVFCGSILGCLIAFMRLSKFKPLEKFASIYITVIRGTPIFFEKFTTEKQFCIMFFFVNIFIFRKKQNPAVMQSSVFCYSERESLTISPTPI